MTDRKRADRSCKAGAQSHTDAEEFEPRQVLAMNMVGPAGIEPATNRL